MHEYGSVNRNQKWQVDDNASANYRVYIPPADEALEIRSPTTDSLPIGCRRRTAFRCTNASEKNCGFIPGNAVANYLDKSERMCRVSEDGGRLH